VGGARAEPSGAEPAEGAERGRCVESEEYIEAAAANGGDDELVGCSSIGCSSCSCSCCSCNISSR